MILKVIDLFAGVGGFRLGLQRAGHQVVWGNQWEPGRKVQHAYDCYVRHFTSKDFSNEDIGLVSAEDIPDHDLLVGGFPCQDYSVATSNAQGLHGKKGVLWWEIYRILKDKRPRFFLLENVDRLLRSPTSNRGRDFGIMLSSLSTLGYDVEWRVINAADYGFPQKRRRVFIFGARNQGRKGQGYTQWSKYMREHVLSENYLTELGFFAQNFKSAHDELSFELHPDSPSVVLDDDVQKVSDDFSFHFLKAGIMIDNKIWTKKVIPLKEGVTTLRDVLQSEKVVGKEYYVDGEVMDTWKYLKGAKKERRRTQSGHEYNYSEGALPFPEDLKQPARTILTNEGGVSPSRFKHLIGVNGKYRRLTPIEVERLNGFDDGWTEGMPEGARYFCMGNALVVGLVERIGKILADTDPQKIVLNS